MPAQSRNATVNGPVMDTTTGATIFNATVELRDEATSLKYSTKTNREGNYVVPDLSPAMPAMDDFSIEHSPTDFRPGDCVVRLSPN